MFISTPKIRYRLSENFIHDADYIAHIQTEVNDIIHKTSLLEGSFFILQYVTSRP